MKMEIIDSPLWNDANEVMATGETTTNYSWAALVHYEGFDYKVLQVTQVNTVRDYIQNYTEDLTCTFLIPLGKYARKIYPNRKNLEITLIKYPLHERSINTDNSKSISSQRYKANIVGDDPSPTDGQAHEYTDEDKLDLSDILEVHFELRTFAVDQIRFLSFGGIWRKTTTSTAIRTILTKECEKIDVDEEYKLQGITIVDGSNSTPVEQIIFTHGTPLIEAVGTMQKRWGVYNSGVGHFIQDLYWYVYPLYDTKEIDKRQKTITLIVLPSNKYSNVERTFKINGNTTTIIVTGETAMQDDDGSQYLNDGNGARFADANTQVDSWGKTGGNKLKIKRTEQNSEFFSQDKTENKQNYAPVVQQRITANPYTVASSLNARAGGYFKGVWENHDSAVLTPGIPMRIQTLDNGKLVEYEGILHHVISRSVNIGDLSSKKYRNFAVITVFIKKVLTEELVQE